MYGQDFCIFSDTSLTNHMLTEEALFIFTGYQESYSDACTEIHLEFFFTMKVGQNSIFVLMIEGS